MSNKKRERCCSKRPCSFVRLVLLLVVTSSNVSTTQHELICQHDQCTANTRLRNGIIQCFDLIRVFHFFATHCTSIAHLNLVVIIHALDLFVDYTRWLYTTHHFVTIFINQNMVLVHGCRNILSTVVLLHSPLTSQHSFFEFFDFSAVTLL